MQKINSLYRIFENTVNSIMRNHRMSSLDTFKIVCDMIIISTLNRKYQNSNLPDSFTEFTAQKKLYQDEFRHDFFISAGFQTSDSTIIDTVKHIQKMEPFMDDYQQTQDMLGNILEKYINRKETGSYYTPNDVTNYMVKHTLFQTIFQKTTYVKRVLKLINHFINTGELAKPSKLGVSKINDLSDVILYNIDLDPSLPLLFSNLTHGELYELVSIISSLKIIDPTCGSGSFIVSSFDYLYNFLRLVNIKYELSMATIGKMILKTLHGVDISSEAITLLKMRIILKMVSLNLESLPISSIINSNFKVANALYGRDFKFDDSTGGFDWTSFGYTFDCVIGNPPYVETRTATTEISDNFESIKCGNLYAMTLERGFNISHLGSYIAFIVPLSLVSTKRMETIRNIVIENSHSLFLSHFADRPGSLFAGVHQRLTIFISKVGKPNKHIYSTKYNYWNKRDRISLFRNIEYFENIYSGTVKIGNDLENSIYHKIIKHPRHKDNNKHTQFALYVSSRLGLWAKSFVTPQKSKEFFVLYFSNESTMHLANSFVNSSLFYVFWTMITDCWHVGKKDVIKFLPNFQQIDVKTKQTLITLSKKLIIDIENNKTYIGSKQVDYEYKHKYSKPIIDDIDTAISYVFDLNENELNYVKKYALMYRMNDFYESYLKGEKR